MFLELNGEDRYCYHVFMLIFKGEWQSVISKTLSLPLIILPIL